MSCIHIRGTRRRGRPDGAPLRFLSPKHRERQVIANALSDNVKIREAAAANPSLPFDYMRDLAWDSEPSVRAWVARNPSAPGDLLEWLALDKDFSVRVFVAWNANTPLSWLKYMAKNDTHETVRKAAQTVLDNMP